MKDRSFPAPRTTQYMLFLSAQNQCLASSIALLLCAALPRSLARSVRFFFFATFAQAPPGVTPRLVSIEHMARISCVAKNAAVAYIFSLRLIRLFLIGRALVMRHSLLCCCLKYPTPVITTTSCCRLSLLISVLLPPRLSMLLRCRCCSYYYGYCYGRASAAVTMVISAVVSTSRSTSHCL